MILIQDVCVQLSDKMVLSHIDVTLSNGAILGIIGPPAAGKTVLLKTLSGLLPITSGSVLVDGIPIQFDEDKQSAWQQRIGMSFQNNALFDNMTVFDNVAFPLRVRHMDENIVQQQVMQRLTDVGLQQSSHKLPRELSGGMRKRVGIARATVAKPEYGFFDDPIAGLDPVTSTHILDLIVRLSSEHAMTTVIVSNDLPLLLPYCDKVMMLQNGLPLFFGDPERLLECSTEDVVRFVASVPEVSLR